MANSSNKKYVFNVHNMHCQSCVFLTESELTNHPNVSSVKSSLTTCTVEISGDFGDKPLEVIIEELTNHLSQHSLSINEPNVLAVKNTNKSKWQDFKIAIPIALGLAVLFVLLQKLGIVNLVNASNVNYGTAFFIGVIASLSTCMAIVGGLVLSLSATFAKNGDKVKPQVLFHLGRLISFFILGGVIGSIGSVFSLNSYGTFILSLVVGWSCLFLE
jgi:cation transport ATPase